MNLQATLPIAAPKKGSNLAKAGVAIPLLVVIIGAVWLGGAWITSVICLVAGLGVGEFYRAVLSGEPEHPATRNVLCDLGILAGAALPLAGAAFPTAYWPLLVLPVLAILNLLQGLIDESYQYTQPSREESPWIAALEAVMLIGGGMGAFAAFGNLPSGVRWLCVAIGLNFASDIFSSFIGKGGSVLLRRFNIPKPCPKISPNKTWAGYVGGAAATVGTGLILSHWFGSTAMYLGFAIALTAPFGDLFGSMLKRALAIDDWSRLLGPHGGLYDRLDSLLFTGPTAYLIVLLMLNSQI